MYEKSPYVVIRKGMFKSRMLIYNSVNLINPDLQQ